jgi:glycosyltransferase involved in cell wall biosynthesis
MRDLRESPLTAEAQSTPSKQNVFRTAAKAASSQRAGCRAKNAKIAKLDIISPQRRGEHREKRGVLLALRVLPIALCVLCVSVVNTTVNLERRPSNLVFNLGARGTVMKNPYLSVVVPVFNEAENIAPLYDSVKAALNDVEYSWETVFIDDGSTDDTYKALEQLHSDGETLQIVRLRRNFGQTAAMAAGLDHARGEVIVTLDGDLQNDPRDITVLVDKLTEGYDLVSGWRIDRQDSFGRCVVSKIANRVISLVTGVYLHDYGCTLKALRRDLARQLKLYGEMHRFIPALAANVGASILEVPVRHHARKHGRSKYGFSRTIRVILDLLTIKFLSGYLTRPGHVFGSVGILAFFAGSAITAVLGVQRLFGGSGLADRPILFLGILLIIVGTQFITMGLLGEMLSRVYHEGQDKPVYVVRDILTFGDTAPVARGEELPTRAAVAPLR